MPDLFFDYQLPPELVAQEPLTQRDQSRLLVVDRKSGTLSDCYFHEVVHFFSPGDVLALNDTKVFAARLLGKKKQTLGKVDILLLSPYQKQLTTSDETMSAGEALEWASKTIWKCLLQPALREGQEIVFENEKVEAVFLKRDVDGIPLLEFLGTEDPRELARRIGHMPLPPYIKREDASADRGRYQTVYAKSEGAVAAPTAGLHFTDELLSQITAKGVAIAPLTLHVGYGTFKPVENLQTHRIHSESFDLSQTTAALLNAAKARQSKVWAVGTTSARTLETCIQNHQVVPGRGETDLFIQEPFEFEVVDHLITNFHLPKTTLLLLVGAMTGSSLLKKAYEHAIREKYRFYSYGDAMLIL